MVAKVGADVAHAQPAVAGLQVLGVLIGRLVQRVDLQKEHTRSTGN